MVYHHSLFSKFVLLVGHFTKNSLISVLFQFCLSMIILFMSTFISFRLCLLSPQGLRLQFPYIAHLYVSSPSDACHLFARLNRLHLISLPVFTEKHKTPCCLFQSPVYSSLCRPHVSLSTIFSSHLSLRRPLPPSLAHTHTHTHTHTHNDQTHKSYIHTTHSLYPHTLLSPFVITATTSFQFVVAPLIYCFRLVSSGKQKRTDLDLTLKKTCAWYDILN